MWPSIGYEVHIIATYVRGLYINAVFSPALSSGLQCPLSIRDEIFEYGCELGAAQRGRRYNEIGLN